ncbi:MAG: hypothetical protein HYR85_04505 [Planctomycetes bacterium]|nr:hypothetical protein [Planctomycetota bacterium]MBI3844099.1 hypothetical protein [Planctomycetota bacterium]
MNANRRKQSERGTILVVTLVAAILVVGFAYAFLIVTRGEMEGAKAGARREKALQAAEAGVDEFLDRLNSGSLSDPNRIGNPTIVSTGAIDRTREAQLPYAVNWEDSAATTGGVSVVTLRSQATVGGDPNDPMAERRVEVVLENRALALRPRAAISSRGAVRVAGNTIIDGRDHRLLDGSVIGSSDPNSPSPPGVFAVSSSGLVTVSGAAMVGGHGHDPTSDPTQILDIIQQSMPYGDGIDQDGDGRIDEESPDGIDNDGDGLVDEDLSQYPSSPDALLGLPDGTLKRVAQTQGTYFTTESDFLAYLSQNGNQVPGGKILVLDFPATAQAGPVLTPMNFGDSYNDDPSIFVFHSEYSNAVLGDLQGHFKGFVLADVIAHRNGDARIIGGLYAFSSGRSRFGSNYGSGSLSVSFSSEALGSLPLVPYFSPRAWREVAVNRAPAQR